MADKLSTPEACYGILPTGREVSTTIFCRDRNCSSVDHRISGEPGPKALLRTGYRAQRSSFSAFTQSTFRSKSSQSKAELNRLSPEELESYSANWQLAKGTLPAGSSRWSFRHLITQVRAGKIKRKSCILFVLAPCTIILVIIIVVVTIFTVGARKHPNLNVDLGYTQYKGIRTPNGIDKWLGMRYAAPPLGDLRFRAPQDPLAASKRNAFEVSLLPLLLNVA